MSIRYLGIRRMSGTDGPGLRTALVLKGCPMACKWCLVPEGIHRKKQVLWRGERCLRCEDCVAACGAGALTLSPAGLEIDRRKCEGCFACVTACPSAALLPLGLTAEPEALCELLLRDRAYFGAEGGVTLTGGEALLQEESLTLLRLLRAEGVRTAVDTCGMLFPQQFELALPETDLVLYDLKFMDDRLHRNFTGQGNGLILKNFGAAAKWAKGQGRLFVRTPLIPGATDTVENIRALGERIAAVESVERWELLTFDGRCSGMYQRLGLRWAYEGVAPVCGERAELLLKTARETGACPDIRLTGPLSERA